MDHKIILITIIFLSNQMLNSHNLQTKPSGKNFDQIKSSVDSLENSINNLKEITDSIYYELGKRSGNIENLIKESKEQQFDLSRDLISPVLISIFSAIIFWAAFSFLPDIKRRLKLRPKLELEMYHAYNTIFSLFDTIMRGDSHSPSNFQNKIRGNKLSFEDIQLGLQNKCLNESYLYDNNVNRSMIIIGRSLFEDASKIYQTVERLFSFSSLLSSDEILLLEKIRKKLETYDLKNYNVTAITLLNGIELKPINCSLAYMAKNLSELYKLFIELQDSVFQNKYNDRNISINKVQHYFYSDQFKKCIKSINAAIQKYPEDKQLLELYLFLCLYLSGKKDKSYNLLESILNNKPHLVSYRTFFHNVQHDDKIKSLLQKCYSESEIAEYNRVIQEENHFHNSFIEQATRLKKYFKDKSDRNLAMGKQKE